jgi:hypothetical protein
MLETDPVDIALDADGDLEIDPLNGLAFVAGLEGVEQLCRIAVQMFMGEWFADLDEGVDWFGKILGQRFNENVIRAEIRRVLLMVPNVTEVLAVLPSFDRATRVCDIKWQTRTVWGDTSVDSLAQVV